MTNPPAATVTTRTRRATLDTHLRWVPLDDIRYPEEGNGQRDCRSGRVARITSRGFDLDLMGYPVASQRDGHYWVLDGHARIEALKVWLGEWHGQTVQCRVYVGLTVSDEAGIFLQLNDFTQVTAMQKFKNAVTNDRPVETDIDRIVRAHGLVVSRESKRDDSVSCVTACANVYQRSGPAVFAQTVRVTRDAYGKPGFTSPVVEGLGMLCTRYNGQLVESDAVKKLGAVRGGVNGLLGRAQTIRRQTDAALKEAIAAAAVDIINTGQANGSKLKPWFKNQRPAASSAVA